MEITTVVWDTQSGDRLARIEGASGSWQRGRVVDQQAVVPLRSLDITRAEAWDLFGAENPRDRVWTVLADDVPVYHGLILDTDYQPATGNLTVTHVDLRELAGGRWLFGIGASNQTFRFTGMSWRGIARRIARIIFTDPISAAWPVPLTLPAEESGDKKFETFGWEFRTGESLLKEIEEMPGGPDLDFHPTLSGGRFGWDLRIGTPYLGGPTFEYNLQAAKSPLLDVNVKRVGRNKVTGVHGIGEGSEWDMIRGGAAAPVSAGLARDTKVTVKSAKLDQVNERSSGYLASRLRPQQQWSFNIRADEINLETLRIGSTIRVESRGDEWIPDGWTEHRVLGFSGTLEDPEKIALTLETQ